MTFHGENCQVLNISAPTGNVNSMESGSHCDGWEHLGWWRVLLVVSDADVSCTGEEWRTLAWNWGHVEMYLKS